MGTTWGKIFGGSGPSDRMDEDTPDDGGSMGPPSRRVTTVTMDTAKDPCRIANFIDFLTGKKSNSESPVDIWMLRFKEGAFFQGKSLAGQEAVLKLYTGLPPDAEPPPWIAAEQAVATYESERAARVAGRSSSSTAAVAQPPRMAIDLRDFESSPTSVATPAAVSMVAGSTTSSSTRAATVRRIRNTAWKTAAKKYKARKYNDAIAALDYEQEVYLRVNYLLDKGISPSFARYLGGTRKGVDCSFQTMVGVLNHLTSVEPQALRIKQAPAAYVERIKRIVAWCRWNETATAAAAPEAAAPGSKRKFEDNAGASKRFASEAPAFAIGTSKPPASSAARRAAPPRVVPAPVVKPPPTTAELDAARPLVSKSLSEDEWIAVATEVHRDKVYDNVASVTMPVHGPVPDPDMYLDPVAALIRQTAFMDMNPDTKYGSVAKKKRPAIQTAVTMKHLYGRVDAPVIRHYLTAQRYKFMLTARLKEPVAAEYFSRERFPDGTLTLKNIQVAGVVAQVLCACHIMDIFGLAHNDLHSGNVFIVESKDAIPTAFADYDPETNKHRIIGESVFTSVRLPSIAIYDFDHAFYPELGPNPANIEEDEADPSGFCHTGNSCNLLEPRKEAVRFLVSLHKIFRVEKQEESAAFIEDLILGGEQPGDEELTMRLWRAKKKTSKTLRDFVRAVAGSKNENWLLLPTSPKGRIPAEFFRRCRPLPEMVQRIADYL